jgi:hypothetical protein
MIGRSCTTNVVFMALVGVPPVLLGSKASARLMGRVYPTNSRCRSQKSGSRSHRSGSSPFPLPRRNGWLSWLMLRRSWQP